MISRRSFIKIATPLVAGFPALAKAQTAVQRRKFNDDDLPAAREQLLNLINADRLESRPESTSAQTLSPTRSRPEHAQDMARGQFMSHWGSDGRKPITGLHLPAAPTRCRRMPRPATNIQSLTPERNLEDLRDMHASMMAEVPPRDGHRRNHS
jgi:hypothetical protein